MCTRGTRPTRRYSPGAAVGRAPGARGTGGGARAAARDVRGTDAALRELERRHGARLGVFGHNPATGATVLHRADERFPICSLYKPLAAAAVLRDLGRDGALPGRTVRYTADDLVGYAPRTAAPDHLAHGMTAVELCRAAVEAGDDTAGNLLLRLLGGPAALTRFCRSLGDPVTRLDHWEPDIGSAEPWRITDTTSPRCVARTFRRITLGDVLGAPDRRRLTGWLRNATAGGTRLAAGLPGGWTVAGQTGSGGFGSDNDVGVARPPCGTPVVLAVLTTRPRMPDARPDGALVTATAALLAGALT
ncbi:class A beta-lactamase [Streptomyces sp. SL13]|uniref:Class A beta-lactamase n=1 Tax=Streptantibioticus silvisoli TaxID=2705255 RepID=A0AA90H1D4_9ACTN|nr:class A beta-lactamase [Streptantibioticus silvisoli]MDI5969094.1 class A beta-lactamase [Streptantibioticus silvisoli]